MSKEMSPIQVGDISISTKANCHMAGPCTIESVEQAFNIAANVIPREVDVFRGGAFKPRTNPEAFQGRGEEGLEILFDVGRGYDIPVVTEVMESGQIDLIKKKSKGHPFIFQIGTRNAQNYSLLEDVGETGIPVILKRGKGSKVSEMIGAAGYVMKGGSPVIMCERGIETFSSASGTGRSTADLLAITQFQDAGFITILDPSHAGGEPDYVIRLALAAVVSGANGTIVEVGEVDENGKCHAQCDAQQALSFEQFATFLQKAKKIEGVINSADTAQTEPIGDQLDILRGEIEVFDREILNFIDQRTEVVKKIGQFKKQNNQPMLDSDRWGKVLTSRINIAKKLGLNPSLIQEIWDALHKEALEIEESMGD